MSEASRLEAEAHELIARGHALLARAARLRETVDVPGGGDELVALADSCLDARARRRLEVEGRLAVTRIGRRKYTTRAALAALVTPTGRAAPTQAGREGPEQAARRAYAQLAAVRPGKARASG